MRSPVGRHLAITILRREVSLVDSRPVRQTLVRVVSIGLMLGACVQVSVGPIVRPSPGGPGWEVYQLPQTLVAISLPPAWRVVELNDRAEDTLGKATTDSTLAEQLRPIVVQLRGGGVKFFAFDPTTPVGNFAPRQFPALAFVARTAPAPSNVDAFFAGLPAEPRGREVIDVRHLAGPIGDVVVRRVRETRIRDDGSFEISIQYQCAVIANGALSILNMQVPMTAFGTYEDTLDRIARSFAPM